MLLAKIRDVLFNRRNKVEVDEVEVKGAIPTSIKSLIQSLASEVDGGKIKSGYFIWDNETQTLVNVGNEAPEDYNGFCIFISYDDDLITVGFVENQIFTIQTSISSNGISIVAENENADFSSKGVSKLNFVSLTHSFAELDETLQGIIEDAIYDNWTDGVACSEAQWSAIKSLLDKSLCINYGGNSMMKTMFDGISNYIFGIALQHTGASLEISYDNNAHLLNIAYIEV